MVEVGKAYRHFKGFKGKVTSITKHTGQEEKYPDIQYHFEAIDD